MQEILLIGGITLIPTYLIILTIVSYNSRKDALNTQKVFKYMNYKNPSQFVSFTIK